MNTIHNPFFGIALSKHKGIWALSKGCDKLRYTQNEIITRIAEKTHYTPNTVKDVLIGCKDVLIELLKFKPKEDMLIELWEGFKIKRYYEEESKFSGILQNMECTEKLRIKPIITKPFKQKINKAVF